MNTSSAMQGYYAAQGDRLADVSSISLVSQFHCKFGLQYSGAPRMLPNDILTLRLKRLQEELDEYSRAVVHFKRAELTNDREEMAAQLEQMLDALVDLKYVVEGTADLHGFTPIFNQAFGRVHAANMRKERAVKAEDSKYGSTVDIIKPKGWEAPQLADLLELASANAAQQELPTPEA